MSSFIEKRNRKQIFEIFSQLEPHVEAVKELINQHSMKIVDKIAENLGAVTKYVNQVLKLYPEIKDMGIKIEIKANLQFYYDLMAKLSDFLRHVEQFHKLHEDYYKVIFEFLEEKEHLIHTKYHQIAQQELIAFYDEGRRERLSHILEQKMAAGEREYFTIGPLEQEIKKIAKIAGADIISIKTASSLENIDPLNPKEILESAESVVNFAVMYDEKHIERMRLRKETDEYIDYKQKAHEKLIKIDAELKDYLQSKGYQTANYQDLTQLSKVSPKTVQSTMEKLDLKRRYLSDGKPITKTHHFLIASILTDAKLLSDT